LHVECWFGSVFFCLAEFGSCVSVQSRTADIADSANAEFLKSRTGKQQACEEGHEYDGMKIASLIQKGGYEHIESHVNDILDKAEDDPPLMF
jgi:hypothetical protein